jgi:hypothetical protein
LNETVENSCKKIFKPYDKKQDKTESLVSDADQELILKIPFTGVVKLKSFCLIGGPEGESPSKVKLSPSFNVVAFTQLVGLRIHRFVNRDDIDFSNAEELKPIQIIELAENLLGEIEWPLQVYNFNNVSTLVMYFTENYGADKSRIYYLGLKGEFSQVKREAVVANYELRPAAAKNDPTQIKFNSTVQ